MLNLKVDDNLKIILVALIHSQLIDYKTYLPYCDSKILELDNPPEWLLDLAMNSNAYNDGSYISYYIEDNIFFKNLLFEDLIVACYYLRYKNNTLDWYEFLVKSGMYTDAFASKWWCEKFFYPSTEYFESGYNPKLQKSQEEIFLKDYQGEVNFIEEYYNYFKQFYNPNY